MISRRKSLGILASAVYTCAGGWSAERCLYALAASTDDFVELKFPAVLFSLGPDAREILWGAQLFTAAQGIDYVLCSRDGKLAVMGGPPDLRDQLVVLSFASPGRPRPLKLDLKGMYVGGRHLVWFQEGFWLAVRLYRDRKFQLLGVQLDDLSVKEFKPEQLYQQFAIDGEAGGLLPNNDFAYLEQAAGSRRLMVAEWPPPRFPSPFVLPGSVSFSEKDLIRLSVANREFAAVISEDTRVWKGMDGYTPVRLLDQRKQTWHSIEVPGALSAFRGFGPWLVVHVRFNLEPKPVRGVPLSRDENEVALKHSPGQGRRHQSISPTGPTFDSRAGERQIYQPGLIYLYHVPTRRKIVEETGQGDTEVLWVENDRVLYRCDRILYEARIDGISLKDKRKLIERDFIADVHWVFYGPPSPPPPDPPWTVFKDYEK